MDHNIGAQSKDSLGFGGSGTYGSGVESQGLGGVGFRGKLVEVWGAKAQTPKP